MAGSQAFLQRGFNPYSQVGEINNDNPTSNVDAMSAPQNADEAKHIYNSNMELITKGIAEKSVVDKYFSGFNRPSYQSFIASSDCVKIGAETGWTNGDELRFRIDPGNILGTPVSGFNPMLTTLTVKGRFYDEKGGDLKKTDAPCNGWQLRIFSDVKEETLFGSSITPSEQEPIGSNLKRIFPLIIDKNRAKIEIDYSDAYITEGKRKIEKENPAQSNADLDKRRENSKYAVYNAETTYEFPIKFLAQSFQRNCIDVDGVVLTLKRQKDTSKYMESVRKSETRSVNVGRFEITEKPYLTVNRYTLTANAQSFYQQMFTNTGKYDYGSVPNPTICSMQMTTGKSSETFQLTGCVKQFDFLKFELCNNESVDHYSPFDSYEEEKASMEIRKIELYNVKFTNSNAQTILYDLTEEVDKRQLYKTWLGYRINSFSDQNASEYAAFSGAENLPSYAQFYANPHDIIVDLRDSRGYLAEPEPINRTHEGLIAKITLKAAVPKDRTYKLTMTAYNRAHYIRTWDEKSTKITYEELTVNNLMFPPEGSKETISYNSDNPSARNRA